MLKEKQYNRLDELIKEVPCSIEHETQYNTLDELIAAMRAAELLGFGYRTRTIQLNGFTVKDRKYIITVEVPF